MIYLDSAAVVKLAHAEPESGALRRWLDERAETGWISSVLTKIEAFRALARYAPAVVPRLPAVLDQIDLIGSRAAYPDPGPGRRAGHGAQPGRYSPRHSLALPSRADLVRDL